MVGGFFFSFPLFSSTRAIGSMAAAAATASKAVFPTLEVEWNPDGWGPLGPPAQYADIPYQPFSKNDRLGKAADFTGTSMFRGRGTVR
jgi:translation initiation factor 3 subunit D